jgi:UDP-GlcNAc:undecaprenyl-phosphate GlcNAc-1-phosphate transferase
MRLLAVRLGATDTPNQAHKTHRDPVPYLGGVAIVLGVLAITYGAAFLSDFTRQSYVLASTIIAPAVVMAFIGLIDDLRQLKPWPRFVSQNLIAIFATSVLISTDTLGSPTGILFLDFVLTMFWIVGITNSVNFFDNIDGGASGIVAISSFGIFAIAAIEGQVLIASMSIVLAGSTLGFLIWNRSPARIYMGDAGSLFLGILVASLTIRLDTKSQLEILGLLIPVFLLAVPIMDTSVAVIKRIVRGVSPFQGGKDHLSHRLIRKGLEKKKSVILLWCIAFIFALTAMGVMFSTAPLRLVFSILGLVLWATLFLLFLGTPDND